MFQNFEMNKFANAEETRCLFRSQDQFMIVLNHFKSMGFQSKDIWVAWKSTNHRQHLMLEQLIQIDSKSSNPQTKLPATPINPNVYPSASSQEQEEQLVKQVIQLSLQTFGNEANTQEHLRKPNTPTGLINLGRTCYFNVVVQTLFAIKEVRSLLFNIDFNHLPVAADQKENLEFSKYISMAKEFAQLFALMLKGKKAHQNPKKLFESLREASGSGFSIGDENDFWEFQNSAFEVLEKAFARLTGTAVTIPNNQVKDRQNIIAPLLELKQDYFEGSTQSNQKKDEQLTGKQQPLDKLNPNGNTTISNPMTELFYGKLQECITYQDEQSELKKYNESIMGILSLEVKHGDLYKALATSQLFQIPDYEISNGRHTEARVDLRISKAPKILNFYINRLDFDRKKLCTVKLNDQFLFDREIDLDRFCVPQSSDDFSGSNTASTTSGEHQQSKIEKIEKQIEKLEAKLREVTQMVEEEKITSQINGVIGFLSQQVTGLNEGTHVSHSDEEFTDLEDYDLELEKVEKTLGLIGKSQKDQVLGAIDILKTYKEALATQESFYKEKLESLREQKKQLYLNKEKRIYELFSVLMHEGGADSGHYFCYVRRENNKWYKMNDSQASEVTESHVLTEAYGKPGTCRNACSVFYREKKQSIDQDDSVKPAENEKISQNLPVVNVTEKLDNSTDNSLDSLSEDIGSDLNAYVANHDKAFFDCIDLATAKCALEPFKKRLSNELQNRYTQQNTLKTANNLDLISGYISSFSTFLLGVMGFEKYGARQVLVELIDSCDMTEIQSKLKDKQILGQAIEQLFSSLSYEGYDPAKICGSTKEELNILKRSWELAVESAQLLQKALKQAQCTAEQYTEHIILIVAGITNLRMVNSKLWGLSGFFNALNGVLMDNLKVSLLRSCALLDSELQKQKKDNIQKIVKLSVSVVNSVFSELDGHLMREQLLSNYQYSIRTHSVNIALIPPKVYEELRNTLELLQNPAKPSLQFQNVSDYLKSIPSILQNEQERKTFILELQKIIRSTSSALQLWKEFLKKLELSKKIIPNNERLDQEEILYSTFE